MTDWTLRLVACAGLVALLGRLPADVVPGVAFAFAGAGLLIAVAVAARRRPAPAELPA